MGQQYKFMLIDDNAADNFYHEWIIAEAGVAKSVLIFEWAEEALAFLRNGNSEQIDIILLDINMPRMDGFEFLEAYSQLPEEKQVGVVVVMLTTSLNPADRSRAEKHILQPYFLSKPLTTEKIHDMIQHCIE